MKGFQNNTSRNLLVLAGIGIVGLIYWLLHTRFYIYYIDDCWALSKVHTWFHFGLNEDRLFKLPGSPDRLLLFRKTFHIVYGNLLEWLGWTKGNAHWISAVCIGLSALIWFHILRILKFSFNLAVLAAFGMLLFPAFFNAANLGRPDAFVFLLASLTFWLFLKKQYFLAGLIQMIAFETHVMGCIASFYIIAYLIYERKYFFGDLKKSLRIFIPFLVGIAMGIGYYLFLHQHTFSLQNVFTILKMKQGSSGFIFPNYLFFYFARDTIFKTFWELVLIGISIHLFRKNHLHKQHRFVAIFLLTIVVSTFITRRGNYNYMIYAYPAFLLFILFTFEQLGKLRQLRLILLVCLSYFYGYHLILNSSFDFQRITNETRKSLVDENIPVVGRSDNWFAAMDREFYPIFINMERTSDHLDTFYLVRNDYIGLWHKKRGRLYKSLEKYGLPSEYTQYYNFIESLEPHYDRKLINQFEGWKGVDVEVYLYTRK